VNLPENTIKIDGMHLDEIDNLITKSQGIERLYRKLVRVERQLDSLKL
jgi:hypothetical protein